MKIHQRVALGFASAGVIALGVGLAVPAGAHVEGSPEEVPAGSETAVTFTVPHGCDESPTNSITIQVPDGVNEAQPQVLAGWTADAKTETLAPPVTNDEGESITERVTEVSWTAEAGNELPTDFRQEFTLGFTAPDTPGKTIEFKVIQGCVDGEVSWIEDTPASGEEPEHPAPEVKIGPAASEGDEGGEEATTTTKASDEEASGTSSTSGDSDDDSSTGLAIAGLVMGALGLAAGGAAIVMVRSRRDSTETS